jgi:hypothetical protein
MDRLLRDFLTTAPAGSAGGVRVRDAELHLDRIPDAVWFTAWFDDQLVGAYALVPRRWGYWRCHLTVRGEPASSITRALVDAALAHAGPTPVSGAVEMSHGVLRTVLVDTGFDLQAETAIRIWTRRQSSDRVRPVRPHEARTVREAVAARGVHRQDPFAVEGFWVLERDGALVAGARPHPLAWYVDHLGPGSRLLLPVLRGAGIELQPLRFTAFLMTFGAPADVGELWSGVLSALGLRVGLVGADVLDPRWPNWRRLHGGLLGRLVGEHRQQVFGSGPVQRPLDWTEGFLR